MAKLLAAEPLPMINAADITPVEVPWLWWPYIPLGRITLIEGDPGIGKSWITCDIAARISAGRTLPGQEVPHPASDVIMLSAEDGLDDTMVPRLIQLGADLRRIHFPDGLFVMNEQNIRRLEQAMRETKAAIVFIDPIQAFFGAGRDMNKANDVREFMAALHKAGERCGAAVVLIRHLRKGSGKGDDSADIYRGLGSIDWVGACRSALQVKELKTGERLLCHVKANNAPKGNTLQYTLDPFAWTATHAPGAFQAMNAKPKKSDAVGEWLKAELNGNPQWGKAVQEKGIRAGHKLGTLDAKKIELCLSRKEGDKWFWYLRPEVQAGLAEPPRLPDFSCPDCSGSGLTTTCDPCPRGCK